MNLSHEAYSYKWRKQAGKKQEKAWQAQPMVKVAREAMSRQVKF